MTSIIKRIKRQRKATPWIRTRWGRRASALRRIMMVQQLTKCILRINSIKRAAFQGRGPEGVIAKAVIAKLIIDTVSELAKVPLYGAKSFPAIKGDS